MREIVLPLTDQLHRCICSSINGTIVCPYLIAGGEKNTAHRCWSYHIPCGRYCNQCDPVQQQQDGHLPTPSSSTSQQPPSLPLTKQVMPQS